MREWRWRWRWWWCVCVCVCVGGDLALADGRVVERCLEFRDKYHLLPYSSATLFVPCGGRPEAVSITNVPQLFKADGTPRFQFVVEGANLFFSQQARLALEGRGVIVFKDASANKGGVTSSSLEVLAALAFTDDEFHEHMQVRPPPHTHIVIIHSPSWTPLTVGLCVGA
jgi:glutamate dehydrogenase